MPSPEVAVRSWRQTTTLQVQEGEPMQWVHTRDKFELNHGLVSIGAPCAKTGSVLHVPVTGRKVSFPRTVCTIMISSSVLDPKFN